MDNYDLNAVILLSVSDKMTEYIWLTEITLYIDI